MKISRLKHLSSTMRSMRYNTIPDLRTTIPYASNSYHTRGLVNVQKNKQSHFGSLGLGSAIRSQHLRGYSGQYFPNALVCGSPFSAVNPYGRSFSSASESKNIPGGTDFAANSSATGTNLNPGGAGGDDWTQKLKEVWQSTVDAVKFTGDKAKEASDEAAPHVQLWLDSNPLLKDVIVPVGSTLAGTLLAWSLLPRILRMFHKYSMKSPAALLWVPVSYEKSIWGALESPIRVFITFAAFLHVGGMVAPTVVLSQYIGQATRAALIISLVWFLHRWKTNSITHLLAAKRFDSVEKDELLLIDKVSSAGLFVLGSMAIAEACGVAVQSILTVGGIGGVATAFAAKDVLGNFLSGLMVQSSRPFSVGDTIKAGSVEGQVIEVGLTSTSLLTTEKFPATVPNSLFFSQVIVNKSRAKYHSVVKRIPLRTEDAEKMTQISDAIKTMLKSNPHVFVEKDASYCYLSQIERTYAVLTFGCNLKEMKNRDGEHDILLKALLIIQGHGVELGTMQDYSTH